MPCFFFDSQCSNAILDNTGWGRGKSRPPISLELTHIMVEATVISSVRVSCKKLILLISVRLSYDSRTQLVADYFLADVAKS